MRSLNVDSVIDKLGRFEKRYYLDEFLRGMGLFLSISLVLLLLLSLMEYFSRNTSAIRAVLWFTFLFLEAAGFIYLIVLPLLRSYGHGKAASKEQMAELIGKKVASVNDRLLNVMLLQRMVGKSNDGLLEAAIEQKSVGLSTIPFHESASFKRGFAFLRIAMVVLLISATIGWTFPDIINYGTRRLVYYETNLVPPAPFTFSLSPGNLTAIKHETLELQVTVSGRMIPREVFIEHEGKRMPAKKRGYNEFEYTFRHVREAFTFRLFAEGFYSDEYRVEVLERPSIISFDVVIDYPAYLDRDQEKLRNQGNLSVPEGAKLTWFIKTQSGGMVILDFSDRRNAIRPENGNAEHSRAVEETQQYRMWASNDQGLRSDTITYQIDVLTDDYPRIEVSESLDSSDARSVHLGRIADDYGITSLKMAYMRGNEKSEFRDIRVEKGSTTQEFLYEIDWKTWNLKDGERVEYYFEVWDNDAPHGKKSTKSQRFYFGLPDKEEIMLEKEQLGEKIEKELENALRETKKLNKDIEKLREELIVDEKEPDWSKKKRLDEILRRREELINQVQHIQEKSVFKNKLEEKLQRSDELMQKHRDLQDLMERIMDKETLELLKKLQELMEKMDKEQLDKSMEKLEMSNQDLEKQLDRSLELFKQLEFEQKLNDVVVELDKQKNDQEELQKDFNEKGNSENIQEKQNQLNESFKDLEKEIEKLNELNQELENKHEIGSMEEERQEVKDSQENAKQSLEKNQKKNASENQKKAAEGMQKMKQGLQSLQMQMQGQAMEDVQSLRNSLENLLELSFKQEGLLEDMKELRGDDPRFREVTMEQRGTLDGMRLVEDSLNALSKRVAQIQPVISRELGEVRKSMEKSLKFMTERKLGEVQQEQQLAMTSINNLAIMLDEIIDQLQKQMMMQSSGQCQKPGQSKANATSLQQLQKKLNQQMEEMKKMQEEGKKPGDSGKNGKSSAESLAKMAADQARIREALRELQQQSSQQEANELKRIGDLMEETERDIVNRNITRETLLRQEKILTRLLESERAEKERDTDEKRESETAVEKNNGNLLDIREYYKARNAEQDRLIKENFSYNRFYKEKVEEYFKTISE